MFNQVNLLRAFTVEQSEDENQIAILNSESLWSNRVTERRIPIYSTVQKFHQNLLSLSSLSVNGFRRTTLQHSSQLLNRFDRDTLLQMMYGLVGNLVDFTGSGDPHYWNLMFRCETECSSANSSNCEFRKSGRKLLQMLQEVDETDSQYKIPIPPNPMKPSQLPYLLFSVVEIEKGSNLRRIFEGCGLYEGIDCSGRTQKEDFTEAEIVEESIIESCFMKKEVISADTEWGDPLIPKLMKILKLDTSDHSRMRLSKILTLVLIDAVKISTALDTVDSCQALLGASHKVSLTRQLGLLRLKFGFFIECLLPVVSYAVLCSVVKPGKLFCKTEVIDLLHKTRNSRAIIFKQPRDCYLGQQDEASVLTLKVNYDSSLEQMLRVAQSSLLEESSGKVIYVLKETQETEKNVIDLTVVDQVLREEENTAIQTELEERTGRTIGTQADGLELVILEDVSRVEDVVIVVPEERQMNSETPQNSGNETPRETDNFRRNAQLCISAAPIVIPSVPSVSGDFNEDESSPDDNSIIIIEETICTRKLIENQNQTETNNDKLRKAVILVEEVINDGNPSSATMREGTSTKAAAQKNCVSLEDTSNAGPKPSHSRTEVESRDQTKTSYKRIDVSNDQEHIPYKMCRISKRSDRLSPVGQTTKDQGKFYEYLRLNTNKISQEQKEKLLKYMESIPVGVKPVTWSRVKDVIGDQLLNYMFMERTGVAKRAAAAVMISRYMSRLTSVYKDGLVNLTQNEFEEIMSDESKWFPIEITNSKLKFMKSKLKASDSKYYLQALFRELYPVELQEQSIQRVLDLCK